MKIRKDLEALREDYKKNKPLDIEQVAGNPIAQFEAWFQDVVDNELLEPNAMTLSTVSAEGRPSSRVVLLKGIDENGFIFYTNYNSKKGKDIQKNPFGAINFLWLPLERQVRIEGKIVRLPKAQSDAYFAKRPRGSQIGAHASPQSDVITGRTFLEENVKNLEEKYKNNPVSRPEHWGGYQLQPDRIEFWQGRSSRLHDRIVYILQEDSSWLIQRLAP